MDSSQAGPRGAVGRGAAAEMERGSLTATEARVDSVLHARGFLRARAERRLTLLKPTEPAGGWQEVMGKVAAEVAHLLRVRRSALRHSEPRFGGQRQEVSFVHTT